MEMIPVLQAAMAANPGDARAPYYLGDLLYDWQPDRAVALWQKSASLNADFPVVYRNLAMVNIRLANNLDSREKALGYLEKAVSVGGNAMVLNDLDRLYEENGVSPEKRLALLERHQSVVNRDDIIAREINLYIFNGRYDDAIALLKTRFFRAWEGGGRFSLGNSWINANLLKGRQQAARGQYKEALASYQAALVLPSNLQEATGNIGIRKAESSYWIGTAYEALGDKGKAQEAFRDAAESTVTAGSGEAGHEVSSRRFRRPMGGIAAGVQIPASAWYYQALALKKLGQSSRAQALYQQLLHTGTSQIADAGPSAADSTASYVPADMRSRLGDAYYLAALGYLGLNDTDKARQELTQALRYSPDHLMAKVTIATMTH
jgi:tetratricopeptide (TPR) repeat protein